MRYFILIGAILAMILSLTITLPALHLLPLNSFTTSVVTTANPGDILISEVEYNPSQLGVVEQSYEWIELVNTTSSAITLEAWEIEDNANKEILPTITINPNEIIIIAATISFTTNYPTFSITDTQTFFISDGTLGNGLQNNADRLILRDQSKKIIDAISWGFDMTILSPSISQVANGRSSERCPINNDTNQASDFIDQASPSPGQASGACSFLPPTDTPTPTFTPTNTPTPTFTPTPNAVTNNDDNDDSNNNDDDDDDNREATPTLISPATETAFPPPTSASPETPEPSPISSPDPTEASSLLPPSPAISPSAPIVTPISPTPPVATTSVPSTVIPPTSAISSSTPVPPANENNPPIDPPQQPTATSAIQIQRPNDSSKIQTSRTTLYGGGATLDLVMQGFPNPVSRNELAFLNIDVTNLGENPAEETIVLVSVMSPFAATQATTSQGLIDVSPSSLFIELGRVAPNQTVNIQIEIQTRNQTSSVIFAHHCSQVVFAEGGPGHACVKLQLLPQGNLSTSLTESDPRLFGFSLFDPLEILKALNLQLENIRGRYRIIYFFGGILTFLVAIILLIYAFYKPRSIFRPPSN